MVGITENKKNGKVVSLSLRRLFVKNPMRRVDIPKKDKKPVDSLTQEQAMQVFQLLPTLLLDFHCILHLLMTTGIRRGERRGLKWGDIDEKARLGRI